MKKILVNAYLDKNLGDDLFLKVLFERYNNVEWVIDTTKSEYKKIFQKYEDVKIIGSLGYKILKRSGLQKLYTYKCDSVIFIGGSIFMQHDGWGKMYKYRNSLLKLFNEKSKFVIGANFGPYKNIEFLEKNKFLLGQCTDVCVRDSYSYNLLSSLNNIRIAPDIVFQLKPKNINKIKNSIGISILNLENRDDLKEYQQIYNKKIKEMVEELINRGQKITFFSFCESQGDMKAINEVIKIVDNKFLKNINIVNYTGDIDDFLIKFESMENIIGTRFHACILSQVFGQGLYPIIYSDKTYNVLKDIDLDKEYIYIKDLEKLNTTHVLDVISSNKIKNEKIFKESEKQFEALDKFIMGRLN